MKIHKITSDFFWAGESKDSTGVPAGWVASVVGRGIVNRSM